MNNKPEVIFKDNEKAITLRFNRPPTQEEFDFWVARVSEAIDYANKATGANVQVIGWKKGQES